MIQFRVGQLAQMLGVHRNTIRNWIQSGKLKASVTVGKKYICSEDDFQNFCSQFNISTTLMEAFRQSRGDTYHMHRNDASFIPKREVNMSEKPIGSVMVVGGGIAGMQATLDLAESGYYVYLVEKSAGIGGTMAQLDKTFPTNDCAM